MPDQVSGIQNQTDIPRTSNGICGDMGWTGENITVRQTRVLRVSQKPILKFKQTFMIRDTFCNFK